MESNTKSIVVSGKISKTDKYLPADILRQLYEVIDNARDLAYIMYHAETGLRVSDVVNSEWVHVDYHECRTYTFDHKKDEWRYIYWPEKVKAVLNRWRLQGQAQGIRDKRIFPFDEKTATRILRRWLKVINFRYWERAGSHWLRHTFIRLSRDAGRDLMLVKNNTGDTVRTILEWYEALDTSRARREVEKSIT